MKLLNIISFILVFMLLLIFVACDDGLDPDPNTKLRLYAAVTNDNGLHIYDLNDMNNPQLVSALTGYTFNDLEVTEDYIYVSAGYDSAQVMSIDFSDLYSPHLNAYSNPSYGNGRGLLFHENRLYLVANGLHVLNISNPDTITALTSYSLYINGGAHVGFHSGNFYLANGDQGLSVLSGSETELTEIGYYFEVDLFPYQVSFIDESFFLMTGYTEGLKYLSCFDPEHLQCFGGLNLRDGYLEVFPEGVVVVNDFAYVSSNVYNQDSVMFTHMELDVIQINDGIDMQLVKRLRYETETMNPTGIVTVYDNYVTAIHGNEGVLIFDITVPEDPVQASYISVANPNAIDLFLR